MTMPCCAFGAQDRAHRGSERIRAVGLPSALSETLKLCGRPRSSRAAHTVVYPCRTGSRVSHQRVIESALAYFLAPLVSILVGTLFFNERITVAQSVAPVAALLLISTIADGALAFDDGVHHTLLLAIAGPVTALPLILFAFSARRVSFVAIGLIAGEPFTALRALSLALIWAGLAIFSWDVWRRARWSRTSG